jgi:two-component system, LytTR family, sensor kinase
MSDNPILENTRNFYIYAFFWVVITLLYVIVLSIGRQNELGIILVDGLISNILLGSLGLSVWYSVKYLPLENNTLTKITVSHIISGLLLSVIWLALCYFILTNMFSADAPFIQFFHNTLPWRFLIGFLFYLMMILFYYNFIISRNLQEKALKEKELRNLVTEAELTSLKFQINPHFIFNSLNSMSALTDVDPERARQMIQKLADFLRYSLQNTNRDKVRLAEEVDTIQLYLDIEKIRFGGKFEFVKDIDINAFSVLIPSMILQPLFENAIKHAVYEAIDKIYIKLYCKKYDDVMTITVENNIDSENSYREGTGVGLTNIKNRLELIYGRNDLLTIEKTPGIFIARILIPIS